MELKEGSGPIVAMCSCGQFLEIFKRDKTFRVLTPEGVDPAGNNPNAPWVATPISDFGSSNLTIARLFLQSREMLDSAMIEGDFDKASIIVHLHSMKETLLACEKLVTRICTDVDRIATQIDTAGVPRDNNGYGLNPFPQVPDLDSEAGAFLVQANRYVRLLCELPQHFIPLERSDTNFDYLAKRLAGAIGGDSPVFQLIRDNSDFVRYVIDLRNFHEHPRDTRTVIENFHVLPDGSIASPCWSLQGRIATPPQPVAQELKVITEILRDLGEILFIHLLMHRISKAFPFIIQEILPDCQDPSLPIRYRLSIDIERLRVQPSTDGA